MRSLLTKIMILVALANAFGAKTVFAQGEAEEHTESALLETPALDDGAHNETHCDSEACARHRCHVHCQSSFFGRSIDFVSMKTVSSLAFPPSTDAVQDEYLSSLIKPPCA